MADLTPVTHFEKVIAKAGGDSAYSAVIPITHTEQIIAKYGGGGGGGSSADYAHSLVMTINDSTFVVTAQLYNKDGDALGNAQTIDLPLESVVVGGSYDSVTKQVVLTLQNGNTVAFSVADLVSGLLPDNYDYTEFGNGKRLYVCATEPTGNIPDGSVWIPASTT